jgi:hypothetical protein
MTETPKQSDQLPEEAPGEQVPDDVAEAGEGAARESAQESAREEAESTSERGYRDDEEQEAYERGAPDAADAEVGGG